MARAAGNAHLPRQRRQDTPDCSRSRGTSQNGTHRAPPRHQCAPTKQRPFPPRRLCCPPGPSSTTAASDARRPAVRFPGPPAIGCHAPVTIPQVTGPGRAFPVPAATIDAFRAPYAGESLTAAPPGSSPLPWPSPRSQGGWALPCPPPRGRLSNDAAGFASCYGPHRRSPCRAFGAGLRPCPFPGEAASPLPGLPVAGWREGRTSTGKRRRAYEHEETPWLTSRRYLLFCWAHEITSVAVAALFLLYDYSIYLPYRARRKSWPLPTLPACCVPTNGRCTHPSHRGPGSRWNARGRSPRWHWPSTCCAGATPGPRRGRRAGSAPHRSRSLLAAGE
jgi:hypothetical protein